MKKSFWIFLLSVLLLTILYFNFPVPEVKRHAQCLFYTESIQEILGETAGATDYTSTAESKNKSWCQMFDDSAKHQYFIKSNVYRCPIYPAKVVMTIHMTSDRFPLLQETAHRWHGPISMSVYASADEFRAFTEQYLSTGHLSNRTNIYTHFILSYGKIYPSNFLRNVAVNFSSFAQHYFLNDIDFVPGINTEKEILRHTVRGDVHGKQALVIPAFQTNHDMTEIPEFREDLLELWNTNKIRPFHYKEFFYGHKATDFHRWNISHDLYQVSYEEYFEPYVVVERNKYLPCYTETLVGRYYDKSSHIYYLHALGYEFWVSTRAFVVHKFHKIDNAASQKYYSCARTAYARYKAAIRKMLPT